MSGLHPNRMRPRDERAHPVVHDAIERGYVASGAVYTVPGISGHDAANEARKSIRVAGDHLGVSVAAWVADEQGNPCYRDCADPQAPHQACFRLFSKDVARQHIATVTGGDPSKLKYNPWQRAEPRLLDDQGRRLR